jgi:hypothetical protein
VAGMLIVSLMTILRHTMAGMMVWCAHYFGMRRDTSLLRVWMRVTLGMSVLGRLIEVMVVHVPS